MRAYRVLCGWADLYLLRNQSSASTLSNHLVLLTVPETHKPSSPLRAFVHTGGSFFPVICMACFLIVFMSLLQCYHISKAFNNHPMYSSPSSLSDSLTWLYFSLSTFHDRNIVCVSVNLLCVPSQENVSLAWAGTCQLCSLLDPQHLERFSPH